MRIIYVYYAYIFIPYTYYTLLLTRFKKQAKVTETFRAITVDFTTG